MKFWFDTEFYEDGRTIELISIGVVAEDGRTYYAESDAASHLAVKSEWLRVNVFSHMTGERVQKTLMAEELIKFMGEKPEIWAYYADYDWVVLCQLFGTMMDLPKTWPMYCRDVKQLCDSIGNPKLPKQTSQEHHALSDALWTKEAWEFCMARMRGALDESVKLQSHYANLLNMHDGGGRLQFKDGEEWIARLAALSGIASS